MKAQNSWLRLIPDALTLSRLLIAIAFVGVLLPLAIIQSWPIAFSASIAFWLITVGIITDVLDGHIARLLKVAGESRIGESDISFDMFMFAGLLIFSGCVGLLSVNIGVGLGIVTAFVGALPLKRFRNHKKLVQIPGFIALFVAFVIFLDWSSLVASWIPFLIGLLILIVNQRRTKELAKERSDDIDGWTKDAKNIWSFLSVPQKLAYSLSFIVLIVLFVLVSHWAVAISVPILLILIIWMIERIIQQPD